MKRRLILVLVPIFLLSFAATGNADLILFTGFDGGAGSASARPNSDAAAASFDAAASLLGSMGIITFETVPVQDLLPNIPLTIGSGVTATVPSTPYGDRSSIAGAPVGSPDNLFGYNTTAGGSEFLNLYGGSVTFDFANPIQAFGVYISGQQFYGESITFEDGSTQSILIPYMEYPYGGVGFVGFTDAGRSIVSVRFDVSNDIDGLDDVRYVNSSATVPDPASSLLLLGIGLASLRAWRRLLP